MNFLRKHYPLITLLALCTLGISIRLLTYSEPFENDICHYAILANKLFQDHLLYGEVWDHKPPAMIFVFMVSQFIFGYNDLSVYMINIFSFAFVLVGIYRLAHSLTGKTSCAILAASIWTIISVDLHLEANQPNTEVFINGLQIWFLYVIIAWQEKKFYWHQVIVGGLLIFLASYFKQSSVIFPVFVVVAVFIASGKSQFKATVIKYLLMALMSLIGWLVTFSYFYLSGRWASFYFAFFEFSRDYAGSLGNNLIRMLALSKLFPLFFLFLLPMLLMYIWGIWRLYKAKKTLVASILLAALIATQVEVALPGYFFNHYYQYWLALLPLGMALCLSESLSFEKKARRIFHIIISCYTIFLVIYELQNYRLTPEEWTLTKYRPAGDYGEVLVDAKEVGIHLDKILRKDENFYLWGFETGTYFYSKRIPPARIIFHWHLIWPQLEEKTRQRLSQWVIDDLSKNPPEVIILAKHARDSFNSGNMVPRWLSQYYTTFPGSDFNRSFLMFIRKDGRIHQELLRQEKEAQ